MAEGRCKWSEALKCRTCSGIQNLTEVFRKIHCPSFFPLFYQLHSDEMTDLKLIIKDLFKSSLHAGLVV